MTPTQKRIASFIKDHWEEKEDSLEDKYYRVYADKTFDGAIRDCSLFGWKLTDVLCFEYVKRENGYEFLQIFVSSSEDDAQDWFSLSDLSRRDYLTVVRRFKKMAALS